MKRSTKIRSAAKGLQMLFYPAALPLSRQALDYTARLIGRHRRRIGSPWRKLNPGRQALLVLAYLRKGETFAELAAGFGIKPAAQKDANRAHARLLTRATAMPRPSWRRLSRSARRRETGCCTCPPREIVTRQASLPAHGMTLIRQPYLVMSPPLRRCGRLCPPGWRSAPWLTNPCWAVTFPERPGRSVAAMGGVQLRAGPVPATAALPGLAAAGGGGPAAPAPAFRAITALPARDRS
jgi:Helix-turn-helix of DDE superfamily endonuclease